MPMLMIVEDDPALATGLTLALHADATQIFSCATLHSARAQLALCARDLMLFNVNVPDDSELTFLGEV